MLRIYETRGRSLLKAISFRLIEIGVDTGLIYLVFSHLDAIAEFLHLSYLQTAFGLAVTLELICLTLHYGFERLWNKINYGRYIVEDKG